MPRHPFSARHFFAFFFTFCLALTAVARDDDAALADFTPADADGRPEYYVAPDGRPDAAGTKDAPWDLRSVLGVEHPIMPGSIIWVRGGTYRGPQVCKLSGAPGKPIIIRAYPGERATINAYIPDAEGKPSYEVRAAWVWTWGLEIMSSAPTRITKSGGWPPGRHEGVVIYGANCKLINVISHDNGQGCAFWTGAVDSELYGNILYHNGWAAGRGSGHGIYTQNAEGAKTISDNIVFRQFGYGIHAYAERTPVQGYRFEGNVCFDNGSLFQRPSDNILFTCNGALSRIALHDNYTYVPEGSDARSCRLDWGPDEVVNEDVTATGNHFIGGTSAVEVWNWKDVTFTGNTLFSAQGYNALLLPGSGRQLADYRWDGNTYLGSDRFALGDQKNLNWEAWKQVTGLDGSSTFTAGRPRGAWTFVRPNKYEPGRAHVVIYNWDRADRVEVDLANAGLSSGGAFEIRDAQNFFGAPVAEGVFDGRPIAIPMTGLTSAIPIGDIPHPPRHTGPDFGAFVVLPK